MYAYKGFKDYEYLIDFLNENNIKKENIIKICNYPNYSYGLIYYIE